MYNDSSTSDVVFHVFEEDAKAIGPKGRIHAHKAVMNTAADVFRTMLTGDFVEGKAPEACGKTCVEVTVKNYESFEQIVRYIYGFDIVRLGDEQMLFGLLDVVEQYQMSDLKKELQDVLMNKLSLSSLGDIYRLAKIYSNEGLREKAMECLKDCTFGVYKSRAFLHFDAEDMLCFLKHDTHLVDETVRFRILEEWIECKGLTDAVPPGLYACLHLDRLPASVLERIDVERCSKELLMDALIRRSQRIFFESNDAFVVTGDAVKTKSWIGHFWGWTLGPALVSNLMAVLAIHIIHTQNKRVHLGFLFELKDRTQDHQRRVLYYDFEQCVFKWGEPSSTSCWGVSKRTLFRQEHASGPKVAISKGTDVILSLDLRSRVVVSIERIEQHAGETTPTSLLVSGKDLIGTFGLDSSYSITSVRPFLECYDSFDCFDMVSV